MFNEEDICVIVCATPVGILRVLATAGCYAGFTVWRSRARKGFSFFLCHNKTEVRSLARLLGGDSRSTQESPERYTWTRSMPSMTWVLPMIADPDRALVGCATDVIRTPWAPARWPLLKVRGCYSFAASGQFRPLALEHWVFLQTK